MNNRIAVFVALLVVVAGVPSLTSSFTSEADRIDESIRRGTGLEPGIVDVSDDDYAGDYAGDHYRQGNPNGPALRVERVHERGTTGEGVQVGILGSSFDGDHPSVVAHVAGDRRFAERTASQYVFDDSGHDTAVAEIVAETAPNASLYLASVGSRPTPASYERAVRWLIANGADVILDAGSYFPPSNDDMARLNDVAENASRQGVVFVTSAGNYADRHWSKNVSADGWVTFRNDSQANPLGDGPISGRVSLRLYWEGAADFDLYLYRVRPGDRSDAVVAKSTATQPDSGRKSEAIDVGVPKGRYYVAIHAPNPTSSTDLRLFSTSQPLAYTTPTGSLVAPAASEDVITVGATDASGALRTYSSRGDVFDVDVSAPDGVETDVAGTFYGTSSAAPYVAGTAALMASEYEDLGPAKAEQILERTARRRNGTPQTDAVEAVAAVERLVESATRNATATNATATDVTTNVSTTNATTTASPGTSNATGTAENSTHADSA